jgi:HEAT repeat protein
MPRIRPSLLAAFLALTACRSTTEEAGWKRTRMPGEDELVVQGQADPLGYALLRIDRSLATWAELRTSAEPDDQRTRRSLERNLRESVRQNQTLFLEELESGATQNRCVVAFALGFSGDAAVLGPLVGVLSDRDPSVVSNALLGIGVLGSPETPLAQVLHLLRSSEDRTTRVNACFALQRLVALGRREAEVAEVLTAALDDEEPAVRAQAATALALAEERAILGRLIDMLGDGSDMVVFATASSLGHLGRSHLEDKGPVARGLVDALDRLRHETRPWCLTQLVLLNDGVSLGEEAGPWREWAYRLP